MISYRKLAMRILGRPLTFLGGGVYKARPLPQRAAALALTAALLTGAAFPAFAGTYYIEDGDIVISAGTKTGTNKVEQGGTLKSANDRGTIISSSNKDTASDNTVTINAANEKDKVEVTLKDLNIDAGSTGSAAVSVTGSGDTTIELDGSNTLNSGSGHAGLEHNKTDTSGELTIQDNDKNGSLKAAGGQYGAGIGGAGAANDAQVKITGGKITATGGEYGAGIGGGFKGSGDVTISGGEIHANGGNYGAGIGGGDYSSGKVTITGGEINATGGYLGAGIGGGEKGSGDVTITGGEITSATGGKYGAGIGGGQEGRGDVTIEGNTEVNAAGGTGGAGIGGGYGAKNNSNSTGNQITIRSNENGSPTVNAVGGGTKKGIADIGGAGIGTGSKSDANTAITLEGKVTIKATAGKGNVAIGTNGNEQVFTGLAGGTSITRKDSDKNDIPPLPGDNVPTPSGGDTAGGGSTDGGSTGGGSAGGDSAGGGSTGGGSTGGDSTGGDSADVSVQESVFPGLVVTGKDGQRTSYTSIRGNNILSLRVGRFTASFRISLSTLRQLRAEGIDTITFQTILCSTTLSVDELLAMGGEDTPVALAHSMGTARLTVGGADHSELLK
ncbi:MAG: hypothetical protein KH336_00170 [Faecalibacterium prausnitzii]|nr:hypothetical protein [Faecalibacterium prausnitzii]